MRARCQPKRGGEGGGGGDQVTAELLAARCGSLLVHASAELAFTAHGCSMLAGRVMDGMEDVTNESFLRGRKHDKLRSVCYT